MAQSIYNVEQVKNMCYDALENVHRTRQHEIQEQYIKAQDSFKPYRCGFLWCKKVSYFRQSAEYNSFFSDKEEPIYQTALWWLIDKYSYNLRSIEKLLYMCYNTENGIIILDADDLQDLKC